MSERGMQGDHGQDGQDGREGREGREGPMGPVGPQGDKGPPFLTRGALVGFIFVVLAFFLLAHRSEVNSSRIDHLRLDQQYQNCLGSQMILTRFDNFVDGMRTVEIRGTKPSSPTYDKSAVPTRLERVALYQGAMIPIPKCVKP